MINTRVTHDNYSYSQDSNLNISRLTFNKTKALLDAGHTNAYYRAVEVILAYGEVLESRWEPDARSQLTKSYKEKYSRYRRFVQVLKEQF